MSEMVEAKVVYSGLFAGSGRSCPSVFVVSAKVQYFQGCRDVEEH
jgi:hypothetical protein